MLVETITPISKERHTLAEGPFWCERSESLYWVDIPQRKVWKWSSVENQTQYWVMHKKVSAVFTTDSDLLTLVMEDGVALFDPASESFEYLIDIDEDISGNRSNDAKVAPDGSLWIGTMDNAEKESTGRLWRISPDAEKTLMLENIGISNTLAWDEVRGVFYFADSMKGQMHAFPYPDFADVRDHDAYITTPEGVGPDGSAIDNDGCIWNAQWDGHRVVKYSPEGEELDVINLPFARPTSCAFGGKNGRTLFVTSASVGLSKRELNEQPLAGYVVAVEVDAQGAPGAPFILNK